LQPLYFAYGSNLNHADWQRWCRDNGHPPDSIRPVGTATLADRELVFHYYAGSRGGGALDLRRRRGQAVDGVLFAVSPAGWIALDAKEGVPNSYQRHPCTAIRPDGSHTPAITYLVVPERRRAFIAPTDAYRTLVHDGLRAYGLDTAMLDQVAAGIAPQPTVTGIFVYGTLLRTETRHYILAEHGLTSVQPATVAGRLVNLGRYPALVLDDQGGSVSGECADMRLPAKTLARLDRFEDARTGGDPGGLYRRTLVTATLEDGQTRRVWTYVIDTPPSGAAALPGGRWR
jgi:gamma-glutamylcyclotransferase (GGCT)/AIG2-like uncharacterized protein YtfP